MKLILFDIDGTLISQTGASVFEMIANGESKFSFAVRKVFGLSVNIDFSTYNGYIDKSILWDCVKNSSITKEAFEKKLPVLAQAMAEYMDTIVTDTALYHAIPTARHFLDLVMNKSGIAYGILSGNVQSIAEWKLDKAGYNHIFQFGLYGEEADDRIELAKKVFVKADAFFHEQFSPKDVSVIGDTVHDIRCGKAIGAHTIAVMTGRHHDPVVLNAEHPDFLVDTLMDNSVLDYFGLKRV